MTELEIYKKCISLGMTPAGAAGCTANIWTESAGNPINVENTCPLSDEEYTRAVDDGRYENFAGDHYGYGFCQWTLRSRKEKYLEYFKGHGVSIGDAETQFQFMAREMREDYPYVWNILTHTASPYEAGAVMCRQFERPQNVEESADARGELAGKIFQRCKDTGVNKVYYDPQKLIDWGYSQVGYHEKASNSQLDDPKANPGDKNYTKYAALLDSLGDFYNGVKQGQMWCDVWYDAGMVICYGRQAAQYLLCQPDRSCGAGCRFSAEYYKAAGRFFKSGPQKADQIFFGTGWDNVTHTGMVVDVRDGRVYTIEGNTSDMVAERNYAINDARIFGYGRPRWGNPEDGAADEEPAPTAGDSGAKVQTCKPEIPLLKMGSKGGYVKCLQRQLIEMGYDCGNKKLLGKEKPDGEFGAATKKAVMDVQKKNGLEQDGEVGADTWPYILDF